MEWIQYSGRQEQVATTTGKIGILAPLRGHRDDTSHRVKRPHTKSRRGCFSCKARKVKCQETKPACANCVTRDLDCIYPSRTHSNASSLPQSELSSLTSTSRLSTTSFTGDDLRFFHHFLLVARPYLPFGSEESWKTQVPAYAHEVSLLEQFGWNVSHQTQCPHLMHAVLSLGATHYALTTQTNSQYAPMAIAHRGKALQLLSTALANVDRCTTAELDGILATCYALVFQSYYMSDGLMDFAIMVRGCGMVTNHMQSKLKRSGMFRLQTREQVVAMVTPSLPKHPYAHQEVLRTCLENLDKLSTLLQSHGEQEFFQALRNTYLGMQQSARDAFIGLTEVYAVWYNMQNREFMKFMASANHVTRSLFVHYFAIDTLVRPFLMDLHKQERPSVPFNAAIVSQWTRTVYDHLPDSMRGLVEYEIKLIQHEEERWFTSCTSGRAIEWNGPS